MLVFETKVFIIPEKNDPEPGIGKVGIVDKWVRGSVQYCGMGCSAGHDFPVRLPPPLAKPHNRCSTNVTNWGTKGAGSSLVFGAWYVHLKSSDCVFWLRSRTDVRRKRRLHAYPRPPIFC